MSFILDALKKSDKERQRGKVPDLHDDHDLPPQKPRRRLRGPIIAAVVGLVVLVNAALLWWWSPWKEPEQPESVAMSDAVIAPGPELPTVPRPEPVVGPPASGNYPEMGPPVESFPRPVEAERGKTEVADALPVQRADGPVSRRTFRPRLTGSGEGHGHGAPPTVSGEGQGRPAAERMPARLESGRMPPAVPAAPPRTAPAMPRPAQSMQQGTADGMQGRSAAANEAGTPAPSPGEPAAAVVSAPHGPSPRSQEIAAMPPEPATTATESPPGGNDQAVMVDQGEDDQATWDDTMGDVAEEGESGPSGEELSPAGKAVHACRDQGLTMYAYEQYELPDISISTLVYDSNATKRKTHINNKMYFEGNTTSEGLFIDEITENDSIIFKYQNKCFEKHW